MTKKYLTAASENAKDLLYRMLEKDPKQRISALEALYHPWFKSDETIILDLIIQNDQAVMRSRHNKSHHQLKDMSIVAAGGSDISNSFDNTCAISNSKG